MNTTLLGAERPSHRHARRKRLMPVRAPMTFSKRKKFDYIAPPA